MSTSSTNTISSSGGLTTNSTLTNDGATGALQITGLASGINTNEIIQAELEEQEQPLTNMESEITGLQTEDSTLSSIQDSLQNVSLDAMMLGEPSLFFQTQTVSSSDSSLVTAATSDGVGAPIGSSTITVSQLASAAQASFTYTAPTSGSDTLSISDGVDEAQQITVAAGTTVNALAEQINDSDSLNVWAAVSSNGQLVLSSRATGSQYAITATDTAHAGNLSAAGTQAGQDAQYTVNGVAGSSSTDTVTGAIPGVTLSLSGVTGSSNPVTVTVASPAPSASTIASAVQQFVTDYNSAVTSIESAVNTAPASESDSSDYNPNSGSLFGDDQLENLLSDMRDAMITPGSGLPSGMAALSDIGITTGASTGTASTSSVAGELTINTSTLESAIESNPSGVEAVLQSFASSFQSLVNAQASPGGAISNRIDGNTTLITNLQSQYTSMQTLFQQQEADMEEQWARVESTLSQLHSQTSSLTSMAAALTDSSSSSSSS